MRFVRKGEGYTTTISRGTVSSVLIVSQMHVVFHCCHYLESRRELEPRKRMVLFYGVHRCLVRNCSLTHISIVRQTAINICAAEYSENPFVLHIFGATGPRKWVPEQIPTPAGLWGFLPLDFV